MFVNPDEMDGVLADHLLLGVRLYRGWMDGHGVWSVNHIIIIIDFCRVIVNKLGSLPGELLIVRNYRHRLLALSHQEGSTALHRSETLPDHDLVSF